MKEGRKKMMKEGREGRVVWIAQNVQKYTLRSPNHPPTQTLACRLMRKAIAFESIAVAPTELPQRTGRRRNKPNHQNNGHMDGELSAVNFAPRMVPPRGFRRPKQKKKRIITNGRMGAS